MSASKMLSAAQLQQLFHTDDVVRAIFETRTASICGRPTKCSLHPRYRIKRKPSRACESCWRLWIAKQDGALVPSLPPPKRKYPKGFKITAECWESRQYPKHKGAKHPKTRPHSTLGTGGPTDYMDERAAPDYLDGRNGDVKRRTSKIPYDDGRG